MYSRGTVGFVFVALIVLTLQTDALFSSTGAGKMVVY